MSEFIIRGGRRLRGALTVHGAKNGVLPILAASYLTDGSCTLRNCPDLSDVRLCGAILRGLGARVQRCGGALLVVTLPCILRARFNLLSLGRMLPADTALLWLTAAAALAAGVLCLPRSRRLRTARRVAVGLALGFAAAAVLLAAIRTLTLYESPAAALSDAWYALAVDLPALSPAAALLAAAGGDPQPSVTVKGD